MTSLYISSKLPLFILELWRVIDVRLWVQQAKGNQSSEGSLPTSAQPGGQQLLRVADI